MDQFFTTDDAPLYETLEYRDVQGQVSRIEARHTSVKTLNVLARVEPSLVASVLSDWIDLRLGVPR